MTSPSKTANSRPTHGRRLTGRHCLCRGCGLYFNSEGAFNAHRTGKFGVDRRCMTEAEMRAAGMVVNAGGWWVERTNDRLLHREAA